MNNALADLSSRTSLIALLAAAALAALSGCGSAAPRVTAPVSLDGDQHLAVRVAAGSVWTGARSWTEAHRAWTVPARGPVEQLTLRALPAASGFEVSFRQGGTTWRGELDADRSPRTPLEMVAAPAANGVGSLAGGFAAGTRGERENP
jgi:hypothetical protein